MKLPFLSKKEANETIGLRDVFTAGEIQRGFIIFSIIYFPVNVLFVKNGDVSQLLMSIYIFLMLLAGCVLLWLHINILGRAIDENLSLQSVLRSTAVNALLPLVMFKVIAQTILDMLPDNHKNLNDFWCDVRHFIFDLYKIFEPQDTLNWVIIGVLVVSGILFLRRLIK